MRRLICACTAVFCSHKLKAKKTIIIFVLRLPSPPPLPPSPFKAIQAPYGRITSLVENKESTKFNSYLYIYYAYENLTFLYIEIFPSFSYYVNICCPKIFCKFVIGGGRVVRRYWVNFQCRGALLIWIVVGHGPATLVVGAGGGCLDIFFSSIIFLFFLPFSARYRLKYCLKGPLNPNQPTNQLNL